VRVGDRAALEAAVRTLAAEVGAAKVGSLVPGVTGNVDLAAVTDPHALEGLGLAVIPGAFAVAENGAVFVSGAVLKPRAAFVVAEHLALVVASGDVVADMHDAYRRVSFPGADFGTFIAGPSKTADIEQALVIGAHGARSLTVFLVG
jgi:L-lactate dehydrogenase complex protein LldG